MQISNSTNYDAIDVAHTGGHEIGHAVGLQHENIKSQPSNVIDSMKYDNLMNQSSPSGSTITRAALLHPKHCYTQNVFKRKCPL
jgi:hypothetical protein